MSSYLMRRFALMLLTLFGMSILIFLVMRLVPGNIADILVDSAGIIDPKQKLKIERILVEDAARPIITHGVSGNCWQPYVKGYTAHANSIYNNTRFEDTWLDK